MKGKKVIKLINKLGMEITLPLTFDQLIKTDLHKISWLISRDSMVKISENLGMNFLDILKICYAKSYDTENNCARELFEKISKKKKKYLRTNQS